MARSRGTGAGVGTASGSSDGAKVEPLEVLTVRATLALEALTVRLPVDDPLRDAGVLLARAFQARLPPLASPPILQALPGGG